MTQPTPEDRAPVEVIQADRDAGYRLALILGRIPASLYREAFDRGEWDQTAEVQAFARHRLAFATPSPSAACDREALIAELLDPWQGNPNNDERGALPNWVGDLLLRAAAALQAPPVPLTAAAASAEQLAHFQLLADVELTLQQARTFITTRQKMHPDGVVLFDEDLAKVSAALSLSSNPTIGVLA